MSDKKYPQRATCEECRHEWIVCWLPMPAHLVGRIFRTMRCPMCGTGGWGLRLLPTQRPQDLPASVQNVEVQA